jgi:hypothetical protein
MLRRKTVAYIHKHLKNVYKDSSQLNYSWMTGIIKMREHHPSLAHPPSAVMPENVVSRIKV